MIGARIVQIHIAFDSKKKKNNYTNNKQVVFIFIYVESCNKRWENYSTTHQVDYDADHDEHA